jgi:hypothetical protein
MSNARCGSGGVAGATAKEIKSKQRKGDIVAPSLDKMEAESGTEFSPTDRSQMKWQKY